MITLRLSSEKAFKRFQNAVRQEAKPPKPFRLTSPTLTERQVAEQIWQWLSWRGWSVFRQQSGLFRRVQDEQRVRVGKVGMADWYAVRPFERGTGPSLLFEFMFLEIKAPGKKPTPVQQEWLAIKRSEGYQAEWFDSLDKFVNFYRDRYGKAE